MMRVAGLGMLALLLLPAEGTSAPSSSRRHGSVALHLETRPSARGCPSAAELRREVSRILGYSPFVRTARTALSCLLWGEGDSRHARLQLRDQKTRKLIGQREISTTGPGCEELAAAVALAIALSVDPLAKPPPRPEAFAAAPLIPAQPGAPPAASPSPGAGPPAGATRSTGGKGTVATAPPAGAARASGGKGTVAAAPPLTLPTAAAVAVEPLTRPPDAGALPLAGPPDAGALPLAGPPDAGPVPLAGPPDAGALPLAGPPDAGPVPLAGPPDAGAVQLAAAAALAAAAPPGAAAPDAGPAETTTPPAAPDAGVAELPAGGAPSDVPLAGSVDQARPWTVFAGVEGDLTLGVLPNTAPGVALFVGVAWKPASVEVEVRWLPATSIAFQGGSVSSSLVSAGLTGCALFGPWAACGTAQAGPFRSSGSGFGQSIETSTWVVGLGARAQWTWVFANPVGLRLHVDGLANLIRPRLLVNASQVWEAPPFSVVVGAGLTAHF